jgi:ATP phosphoribosyltransferase regulatory subunit
LSLAHLALRAAGLAAPDITMGDLGLFYDLLTHLDVPPRFQVKLHHALGRPAAVELLLECGTKAAPSSALISALGQIGPESARQMIEEILGLAQIPTVGGRSIEEIASRFIAKANDAASPPLADHAADAIREFLAMKGSPEIVAKDLERRFGKIGLNLDLFYRRLDLMQRAGLAPEKIHFSCGFARRIDYYTGIVFEMHAPGGDQSSPILAGGRYDGLLKRLGAERSIPAIGFALWPQRLNPS